MFSFSVPSRFLAKLVFFASILSLAGPALAGSNSPVRWESGGFFWTTKLSSFFHFLENGEINDRSLANGIARSGWSAYEIREGMRKSYGVNLIDVSRFLYSDTGVIFLQNQTKSYFPVRKMSESAVPALRSAIIADSVDGSLSAIGIMANLPVAFRLGDGFGTFDGRQNVCASGLCQGAQCTSLLSWYVFLPACVQANQHAPR